MGKAGNMIKRDDGFLTGNGVNQVSGVKGVEKFH
jgi:hypothetical protein